MLTLLDQEMDRHFVSRKGKTPSKVGYRADLHKMN